MHDWIDITRRILWEPNREAVTGPIHLINAAGETKLIECLTELGFEIFLIEGTKIQNKSSLFDELARSFSFPDYFGKNWDAFDECFGDLCYRRRQPIAIIWNNADATCRQALSAFLETIVVFSDTARNARSDAEPLQIEVFWLGTNEQEYVATPVKKK